MERKGKLLYSAKHRFVLNFNIIKKILLLGSIISFGILLNLEIPEVYQMLYIEPVVYAVILSIFINDKILIGNSSCILVIMYFIKLCILPITTVLGDFTSIVSSLIFNYYWDDACIYIALEWIIVAISYNIASKYCIKRKTDIQILLQTNDNKNHINFKLHPFYYISVFGLILLCIVLAGLNRNLFSSFFLIWQLEDNTAASFGGPTWYMFKTFVELVKPLFFFLISIKIYNSKFPAKMALLLGISFLASIILTEYRILSILTGLTILTFVLLKYRNHTIINNIIKTSVVVLSTIAIYYMTTHGEISNQSVSNFGRLLDIYLGGYIVAAASCSVQLENGLFMFLNDTASGSFLLRHILGNSLSTTTDAINLALNEGAQGTFYEMMVQAKDFFGIFAPIGIFLCVLFIVKMDENVEKEQNDLYRMIYIFCGMSVSIFMVMYTYSMITNFIIYKCFVWLLIISIDRRLRIKD
ncbi:hypothetical protein [Acidaminococcus fermentans]|uniref:hypothetical protein n=1 Tax=Acidaminococcus fermentans TaxID=905 RepID=UPI003F8A0DE1